MITQIQLIHSTAILLETRVESIRKKCEGCPAKKPPYSRKKHWIGTRYVLKRTCKNTEVAQKITKKLKNGAATYALLGSIGLKCAAIVSRA